MYWVNSYLQEVWIETYPSVWYPRWVCLRRQVLPLNPVDPPVEGPPTRITREPPTHLLQLARLDVGPTQLCPPTVLQSQGMLSLQTIQNSRLSKALRPGFIPLLAHNGDNKSATLIRWNIFLAKLWQLKRTPLFFTARPLSMAATPPILQLRPGILGFRRCRSTPPSRRWTSQTCWRLFFLSSPFSFLRGVYSAA